MATILVGYFAVGFAFVFGAVCCDGPEKLRFALADDAWKWCWQFAGAVVLWPLFVAIGALALAGRVRL